MYIIETPRLGLRNWIDTDTPGFIKMNADPKVMEYFPETLTSAQTEEMIERITANLRASKFGLWAAEIKETNEFIGFTGLSIPRFQSDFTPCIEIGWRLAYPYWNKGYAQEAALACLDYGFNKLNLDEIVSFTATINTRSINVMKKIGMKYSGEFEHPGIEEGSRLKTHALYKIGTK